MLRWLRAAFAFAAVRFLFAAVSVLPVAVALWAARILGRIFHATSRRRRQIAIRNLEIAFRNTLSLEARSRIARGSFEHLMGSIAWFALRERRIQNAEELFDISPAENALLGADHSEGLVFLSAHVGDWEMAHYYLALRGIKVAVVTREVANRFLDREIARRRSRFGARTIPKRGALSALRAAVRGGEPVGLLADQNCPAREWFFDFFGTQASTYTEFARVLARTHATILFITCVRKERDSHFQVILRDLSTGLPEPVELTSLERARFRADELVRRYLSLVEELVRQQPEQYLWIHRRWKSRPTGAPWLYHDLNRPLNLALLSWKPEDATAGNGMEPG